MASRKKVRSSSPTAKKPTKVASKRASSSSGSSNRAKMFLACFELDEPGTPTHRATFQLVAHAPTPEDAVQRCRKQLRELRARTTLFRRPSTVYFTHVIQLAADFTEPLLVNYTSAEIPERHVEILAAIPEQKDRPGVEAYGPPEDEGTEIEPFLDFGGERVRKSMLATKPRKRAASTQANKPAAGVKPKKTTGVKPKKKN